MEIEIHKVESDTTDVSMKVMCQTCGYIFDKLWYHVDRRVFTPERCPKCGKIISTVVIPNLDRVGLDNQMHLTID